MRLTQPKPITVILATTLTLLLPVLGACSTTGDSPTQNDPVTEEIRTDNYVEPATPQPEPDPTSSGDSANAEDAAESKTPIQETSETEAAAAHTSKEPPPRVKAAESGAQLIGEEYSIKIPEGDERFFDITYDSAWEEVGNDIYYGYEGNVMVRGEQLWDRGLCFRVAVYSDNWAPEGEFYSLSLGHPSNRGDATVYVIQPMYKDESHTEVEDETGDYASWVTVF